MVSDPGEKKSEYFNDVLCLYSRSSRTVVRCIPVFQFVKGTVATQRVNTTINNVYRKKFQKSVHPIRTADIMLTAHNKTASCVVLGGGGEGLVNGS